MTGVTNKLKCFLTHVGTLNFTIYFITRFLYIHLHNYKFHSEVRKCSWQLGRSFKAKNAYNSSTQHSCQKLRKEVSFYLRYDQIFTNY